MKQISILGCGWLGLSLGQKLITEDYIIKGSTTTYDKLFLLKKNQIQPYLIQLNESLNIEDFKDFLENSEILIICIPPKANVENSIKTSATLKKCLPIIENSTVKKVIYTSSISVYPDLNKIITEDEMTYPTTASGQEIIAIENVLLQSNHFKSIILRLGGLIGEDRNPIKYLTGKTDLPKPNAVVNLVHKEDILEIIRRLLIQESATTIYNIVHPNHPTRKAYYTQKAIAQNLVIPVFSESTELGKIISSEKISKELGYKFNYDI